MCDTEYKDAVDGDIYLNPMFRDLWIVVHGCFVKINDGYVIPFDDPCGFVKEKRIMEHIVQFGIGIDDDAIREIVMKKAEKSIMEDLKKEIRSEIVREIFVCETDWYDGKERPVFRTGLRIS